MKRAICKRIAVVCLALAAAGVYVWFGLLLDDLDTQLCAGVAFVCVMAVLWPMTPMPCVYKERTRRRLPHPKNHSWRWQKVVKKDGGKENHDE